MVTPLDGSVPRNSGVRGLASRPSHTSTGSHTDQGRVSEIPALGAKQFNWGDRDRVGRGWVGKHESPTLTPASAAHQQASGAAVSKQGLLLNLLLILSSQRQASSQQLCPLSSRRDQKQKPLGLAWLSPLSQHEVCVQPCQAPFPNREARLWPWWGWRPARSPPGPLPTNQILVDARACSAVFPLLRGPSCHFSPGKGSALCPSKSETI